MAEAMGVEGLAASLAKEKERNAELLHTQVRFTRNMYCVIDAYIIILDYSFLRM
jgi:hypothetical protein